MRLCCQPTNLNIADKQMTWGKIMALQTEVQSMQNPALGAAMIWRFACGYCPANTATAGIPLPLTFLVLPIMLHAQTREAISSTQQRSGIRQFQAGLDLRVDLL